MNSIMPITSVPDEHLHQPGGYRDPLAARWAHVLTGLDVTCDPEDIPEHCNLLPDFGDHEGTLFYCEACVGPAWRPSIVQSACTLVAMAQCRRAVLLGDIQAEEPAIGVVSLPAPDQWWMGLPFTYQSGLHLQIRPTRPGYHAAVLVHRAGGKIVIGPDRSRRHHPWVARTDLQLATLVAEARRMAVAGSKDAA